MRDRERSLLSSCEYDLFYTQVTFSRLQLFLMVTEPVVKQTTSEPFGIIGWEGGVALSFCKHRCGLGDHAASRMLKES